MFIDFRERGRERERGRNINVREKHPLVPSHKHPDLGLNLGMCLDPELNLQNVGIWDDAI